MSEYHTTMFNNQLHTLHIWRYDRLISEFLNTFANSIGGQTRIISQSQYLEESDILDKLRDDYYAIRWRLAFKPYYAYANDDNYRKAKAAYEAQRFLVQLLDTILTHPLHRPYKRGGYHVANFIEAVSRWSEDGAEEQPQRQLSVSDQLSNLM